MNEVFQNLAALAWTQLWQVTLVAAVVLLLVRLLCRKRPHVGYVLLLLVLVKCLVPPVWSSPWGLFSRLVEQSVISMSAGPRVATSNRVKPTPPLPSRLHPDTSPPTRQQPRMRPRQAALASAARSTTSPAEVLLSVWALGVLACALGLIVACVRQRREIGRSSAPASGEVAAIADRLARRLKLRRKIRLLVSSPSHERPSYGPYCFGIVRPTVVLPAELITSNSEAQIEPILAHELAHLRRGDPWAALLQVWATVLWWFHPLVWWTSRQLSREREKCCDQAAVALTGGDAAHYAQAIIDVLRLHGGRRPVYLGSGIRPLEITQERLEALMSRRGRFHSRTPSLAWLALAAGILLVIPGKGYVQELAETGDGREDAAAVAAAPDDEEEENDEEEDDGEQGSDLLRDIRENTAPILAQMAEEYGYGLAPDQDVGRVGPPFPPIRMVYYLTGHPHQAEAIPDGPTSMVFQWNNGRLENWGMSFGESPEKGQTLTSVIDSVLGIKSHELDGDHMLLARASGDWIVRPGRPAAEVAGQLEKILRDELSLPVSLEFREVERTVYVARGDYQLTPLPGRPDQSKLILTDETIYTDPIEVFGKQLAPNSGAGGGTGEFDEFLQWLGRWVEMPILDEVTTRPSRQLTWRLHQRSPFTDQMWKEDHDPDLVLPNITKQTGLEFVKENRKVKILFVEQQE